MFVMHKNAPPGLHRHSSFQPQCTHATMTRIYSPTLLCSSCRYPGPSGWLYQCTQDREDLIEHAVKQGEFVNMDHIGCQLTPMMGIRKGTPAAREDRLSFFKEINQKQLASYQPDQIAKILRQRENVQLAIQRDKIQKNSAAILSRLAQPYGLDSASCSIGLQKPWLCSPQEECQYRVCQNCRPGCADRAFLSLNAVAHGEVLPTAAAGYSFHLLGQRPVIDARNLLDMGCRPVPLSRSSPASTEHDSPASTMSVMDLLDAQIARGRILWTRRQDDAEIEEYDADFDWSLTPTISSITSGHLKYSPGCENLGVLSENASTTFDSQQWTPPPSENDLPGNEATEDDYSGTPSRAQSAPSPKEDVSQSTEGLIIGHVRELSLDESLNKATLGPSQPTNQNFTPFPLKVPHGVAMLEESVELGVPDVITQA
ncbi:uncharacterized protein TrAtP1_009476 [Trichoderma atroviride]|uniref:uncharacterized protein n=1 Tax=Hypocrea atroviridis TaxID=63577 RepID=UPI0033212713|nr:hypothetical protein TrAtP1_009476 [Trichoderma atroviride]